MAPQHILPEGSIVLVTGANGYLASHVVDQLLARGYRVRGTVRDVAGKAWLQELFESRHGKGKFEMVSVPDLSSTKDLHNVLEGVSGIEHIATVSSLSPNPNEVIPQTIDFAVNLANAALEHSNVKRFVYTSSSVAMSFPKPNTKFPIGPNLWNEDVYEPAWAPPPYTQDRAFAVYASSKTEAERALWKFVEEKKPHFVVNAVLPNTILGEILDSKHQMGLTNSIIPAVYHDELEKVSWLPPQHYINVKDTGLLHLAGLLLPDVQNERIIAFAKPFNITDILAILRKLEPERRFPDDPKDEPRDLSDVDSKRALELLKMMGQGEAWTSLEQTVAENIRDQ